MDSANSPTYKEEDNAEGYSGYVLKFFCETNFTTQLASGCGLRHPTHGALWLVSDGTGTDAKTFNLTAAQDTAMLGAGADYIMPAAAEATATSSNLLYF